MKIVFKKQAFTLLLVLAGTIKIATAIIILNI